MHTRDICSPLGSLDAIESVVWKRIYLEVDDGVDVFPLLIHARTSQ